jgi:hypothetical protein
VILATNDSAATFSSTASGGFMIQGIASGSYKVVIILRTPFSISTYTGVMVNSGSVTDIGTITVQ